MEQFFLKLPVQVNEELIEEQIIRISHLSRISRFVYNNRIITEYSKIEFEDNENYCIVKVPFDVLTELIKEKSIKDKLFPIL